MAASDDSASTGDLVGEKLRDYYQAVAEEPLPPAIADLLKKLSSGGADGQS